MKRIILSVVFFLIMAGVSLGDEININISQSTMELRGIDTFRTRNMVVPGVVGYWWVDFKWDPVSLVFVPVNLGPEANAIAVTWELLPDYEDYILTLVSDPSYRKFRVSFAPREYHNSAFVCYLGLDFIQLNRGRFDLTQYSGWIDSNTAMIQWDQPWFSGCETIYEGEVVSATISSIPSWFSFAEPFMLDTGLDTFTLEPDGTYHR